MKHSANRRLSRIPVIGDMLFCLLTLPMALEYVEVTAKGRETELEPITFFIVAFALFGVSRLFRAFRYRRQSKAQFIRFLIYGLMPLAACLLPTEAAAIQVIIFTYWATLIADRVISCVMNHRLRNLLLNLLAVFLLIWSMVGTYTTDDLLFFVMFVLVMHTLLSILGVAFARINLRSLSKVIRETFAAEIIGGLLLLIFAFSYIFRTIEPDLDTLGDALWYCFAIVTTIGFGDVTTTSFVGRVLSVILGMYGIIVVALITSVIVNYYGEMKRENAQADREPAEDEE